MPNNLFFVDSIFRGKGEEEGDNCLGTHVFKTALDCISKGLSKAVLLGRDGAYTTMFDPKVVKDLGINNKLITTDMKFGKASLKYLTLNWINGGVQYYY